MAIMINEWLLGNFSCIFIHFMMSPLATNDSEQKGRGEGREGEMEGGIDKRIYNKFVIFY